MILEKYFDTGLSSRGSHCRFEHLTTRYNLTGIVFNGLHNIAKNIRAIYNGQTGISGIPDHLLIEDAEILGNNTKGITWSYHSGGLKMTQAQSVTLRRVRASFNAGPGLWFDVKNADITVEECTVIGNTGAGIFMEISQGPCLIRNNLAMNNPTGIVIAETDDCTVVNNTCVRNERGFAVRYSDRKGRGQSGRPMRETRPLNGCQSIARKRRALTRCATLSCGTTSLPSTTERSWMRPRSRPIHGETPTRTTTSPTTTCCGQDPARRR